MIEGVSHKKKILICDDDRTHLLILSETLIQQGYDVEQALNGELAVEAYHRFLPDIVLLDVSMPKLNGYKVCSIIRASQTGRNIPILMITGSDENESIEQAFEVGATDFLPKPFKWTLIRHRIKYLLRSSDIQKSLLKSERELRHLAYYDTLTQLPNRQNFTERLASLIALSARQNKPMAVMFIDLDNFKRINDTLGHSYGDIVLKEISSRLTKQLRSSDLVSRPDGTLDPNFDPQSQVARLGGDEFTIVLNDCGNSDKIALVAKRTLEQISKPIAIKQYSVVVTASIGISMCPIDGSNPEDLMKYSNMAMYAAKENGKNSYKLHSKELNDRSLNRLKLEEYMREALLTGNFQLYYQPQVNVANGQIKGAEALIRLNHPSLGIISPGDFIPVAEDTGLIVDIGYWVIKQACEQIKLWQNTSMANNKVSVNVSVKQINQADFVKLLSAIIQQTGIDPKLLDIELTESIIMNNPDQNIVKLNELKKLGVSLSIDDFGTGYSSLSYLKKFPLDTLKIDRSFVVGLSSEKNNEDAAIIRAITAMSDALHLNVVVEGVETQEQLECIKTICCQHRTLIQGFYYSKPIPNDSFLEFAKNFDIQESNKISKIG